MRDEVGHSAKRPPREHAAHTVLSVGHPLYELSHGCSQPSGANVAVWNAPSSRQRPSRTSTAQTTLINSIISASGGVIHDTPNPYDPSGTYTLSSNDFNTTNGTMTWWGAMAWVNYLNARNYGGSTQWALPTIVDNSSSSGFPMVRQVIRRDRRARSDCYSMAV